MSKVATKVRRYRDNVTKSFLRSVRWKICWSAFEPQVKLSSKSRIVFSWIEGRSQKWILGYNIDFDNLVSKKPEFHVPSEKNLSKKFKTGIHLYYVLLSAFFVMVIQTWGDSETIFE